MPGKPTFLAAPDDSLLVCDQAPSQSSSAAREVQRGWSQGPLAKYGCVLSSVLGARLQKARRTYSR